MEEKDLQATVEHLLLAAGIDLLEFEVVHHKGRNKVKAVIYRKEGTGTDECAKAHRLILPQIQMALGDQDPYMEIYSPGIDRVLKTEKEWKVFTGKMIMFQTADEPGWQYGRLLGYEEGTIKIASGETVREIPRTMIRKAKLDSLHEGDKAHGI
ncbi:MAG: hypothetical protein QHH01_06285 [Spirochaetales bacterium]|nr:hypothetical protein [Spirochaetales bacterium]